MNKTVKDVSEALKDYLPTVMYFKCKTAEDFQKAEDYLIEEKIKESESYFRDLYNTLKEKEKGSDDLIG